MYPPAFEQFRALAIADASVRDLLLRETELPEFVQRVIELAAERGFTLTDQDVRSAYEAANRSWITRQVR
jgi:hypothetical protein